MESCTLVPCGSYPDSDHRNHLVRQGKTRRPQTSGQEDRLAGRSAVYSGIHTVVLSAFTGEIYEAWMGNRLSVECYWIKRHFELIILSP